MAVERKASEGTARPLAHSRQALTAVLLLRELQRLQAMLERPEQAAGGLEGSQPDTQPVSAGAQQQQGGA